MLDKSDHTTHYLCAVHLDERSLAPATAEIEHERKVAVYDLLQKNYFRPLGNDVRIGPGPFVLTLSSQEGRLVLALAQRDNTKIGQHHFSPAPLRKIIKDYFLLCDSYYDAIRNASLQQIETIDMARRAMHNEGAEILKQRLVEKVEMDIETARRLFTLICSFYLR